MMQRHEQRGRLVSPNGALFVGVNDVTLCQLSRLFSFVAVLAEFDVYVPVFEEVNKLASRVAVRCQAFACFVFCDESADIESVQAVPNRSRAPSRSDQILRT